MMIELKNITKIYEVNKNNIVTALDNINLEIREGELVVLKGASGSGKSTILSLIAALSKPTSGEIVVETSRVSKLSDNFASDFRRDNIGFVFQKYNLIPALSVKENIILPLVPLNLHVKEIEEKLIRVLKMFHIEHKENQLVKNLSGGEQQRVAITRALMNNPKALLCDEPTGNLDSEMGQEILNILFNLNKKSKTAIVIVTHDKEIARRANRIVEMKDGKII